MTTQNRPLLKTDANKNVLQHSYGDMALRGQSDGNGNIKLLGIARPGSSEDSPVWQIRELMWEDKNIKSQKWPKDQYGRVSTQYEFKWSEKDDLVFV